MTLRADEHLIGAGERGQPRRDLRRRAAQRVPPRVVAQSLGDQDADVDATLDPERRPERLRDRRAHLTSPLAQLERRAHGAKIVVLVGGRHAEQRHDLVADRLIDDAAVPLHDLRRGPPEVAEECLDLAGRQPLDERAVVGHRCHDHRRPAAFRAGGDRCGFIGARRPPRRSRIRPIARPTWTARRARRDPPPRTTSTRSGRPEASPALCAPRRRWRPEDRRARRVIGSGSRVRIASMRAWRLFP